MWLERSIGECEEEMEKLGGLGYYIGLETRHKYFDLKVLYKIDGTGGGRIRIKNKSGEGTLLYKRREGGDTVLLIRPINIKALLNCIIEDCEEERNAEVGV